MFCNLLRLIFSRVVACVVCHVPQRAWILVISCLIMYIPSTLLTLDVFVSGWYPFGEDFPPEMALEMLGQLQESLVSLAEDEDEGADGDPGSELLYPSLSPALRAQRALAHLNGIEFVMARDTDNDFFLSFRMTKEAFRDLVDLVELPRGHRATSSKGDLIGMTVYWLAQGCTYLAAGKYFELSHGLVSHQLPQTLVAITNSLSITPAAWVRFPSTPQERHDEGAGWSWKVGFQHFHHCLGAGDGSLMRVEFRPHRGELTPTQESREPWVSRKDRPAQNVMLVCSHDLTISFCLAGSMGSMHDSPILTQCGVLDLIPGEDVLLCLRCGA